MAAATNRSKQISYPILDAKKTLKLFWWLRQLKIQYLGSTMIRELDYGVLGWRSEVTSCYKSVGSAVGPSNREIRE